MPGVERARKEARLCPGPHPHAQNCKRRKVRSLRELSFSAETPATHRSHTRSASHQQPPRPWAAPAAPPTAGVPALPPESRGPAVHAWAREPLVSSSHQGVSLSLLPRSHSPAPAPGVHLTSLVQQQRVLGAELQPTCPQFRGQGPVQGRQRAHVGAGAGQQGQ